MAWNIGRYPFRHGPYFDRGRFDSIAARVNEQCFIRKEHKCGKMYGASKSCFIACPSDKKLNPILALMSEKLTKLGIEPSIAIKERAYGQDIFCTKICGKIIESQFCVVILDDSLKHKVPVPNPNVYYEYGLMTSLRKHIIPLQKEKLKLAFNIQSHDTIKYNSDNIDMELERGIRDAVRITEAKEAEKTHGLVTERTILRKLEMAGFDMKGDNWFLSDVIEDTAFKGFGHQEAGFYAYVGKIENSDDCQTYLDDLSIIVYRTEKRIDSIKYDIGALTSQKNSLANMGSLFAGGAVRSIIEPSFRDSELYSVEKKIEENERRIELMKNIYIAFIITSDQDMKKFVTSITDNLKPYSRFKPVFSQASKLQIGDICVDFGDTQS